MSDSTRIENLRRTHLNLQEYIDSNYQKICELIKKSGALEEPPRLQIVSIDGILGEFTSEDLEKLNAILKTHIAGQIETSPAGLFYNPSYVFEFEKPRTHQPVQQQPKQRWYHFFSQNHKI
ncbi:MAG: hypothetical protein PHC28_01260 [Flavobacterium sp.]|uniref:hypothetical protein n=1 Tax=Flavobacterium sp. TaxID=239 RepID=UPI0026179A28|nr:hypothetical protein [Flavobacterium sp.]MDD5149097.1 hypothetical protein [Flavobacterium sp.]